MEREEAPANILPAAKIAEAGTRWQTTAAFGAA